MAAHGLELLCRQLHESLSQLDAFKKNAEECVADAQVVIFLNQPQMVTSILQSLEWNDALRLAHASLRFLDELAQNHLRNGLRERQIGLPNEVHIGNCIKSLQQGLPRYLLTMLDLREILQKHISTMRRADPSAATASLYTVHENLGHFACNASTVGMLYTKQPRFTATAKVACEVEIGNCAFSMCEVLSAKGVANKDLRPTASSTIPDSIIFSLQKPEGTIQMTVTNVHQYIMPRSVASSENLKDVSAARFNLQRQETGKLKQRGHEDEAYLNLQLKIPDNPRGVASFREVVVAVDKGGSSEREENSPQSEKSKDCVRPMEQFVTKMKFKLQVLSAGAVIDDISATGEHTVSSLPFVIIRNGNQYRDWVLSALWQLSFTKITQDGQHLVEAAVSYGRLQSVLAFWFRALANDTMRTLNCAEIAYFKDLVRRATSGKNGVKELHHAVADIEHSFIKQQHLHREHKIKVDETNSIAFSIFDYMVGITMLLHIPHVRELWEENLVTITARDAASSTLKQVLADALASGQLNEVQKAQLASNGLFLLRFCEGKYDSISIAYAFCDAYGGVTVSHKAEFDRIKIRNCSLVNLVNEEEDPRTGRKLCKFILRPVAAETTGAVVSNFTISDWLKANDESIANKMAARLGYVLKISTVPETADTNATVQINGSCTAPLAPTQLCEVALSGLAGLQQARDAASKIGVVLDALAFATHEEAFRNCINGHSQCPNRGLPKVPASELWW